MLGISRAQASYGICAVLDCGVCKMKIHALMCMCVYMCACARVSRTHTHTHTHTHRALTPRSCACAWPFKTCLYHCTLLGLCLQANTPVAMVGLRSLWRTFIGREEDTAVSDKCYATLKPWRSATGRNKNCDSPSG